MKSGAWATFRKVLLERTFSESLSTNSFFRGTVRVVQYSDKFMHSIVLSVLYPHNNRLINNTIQLRMMQYNRIQYNAMHKFVRVLEKYGSCSSQ